MTIVVIKALAYTVKVKNPKAPGGDAASRPGPNVASAPGVCFVMAITMGVLRARDAVAAATAMT